LKIHTKKENRISHNSNFYQVIIKN